MSEIEDKYWKRKTTLKKIENGQKLKKLLDKGLSLEEAMKKVGIKTRSAAFEGLRNYKYAVEHNIRLTASGVGWRARLGNWLIDLGKRISKSGGQRKPLGTKRNDGKTEER